MRRRESNSTSGISQRAFEDPGPRCAQRGLGAGSSEVAKKTGRGLFVVLVAAVAFASCGGPTPVAPGHTTIRLARNPWDASMLDVAVAKILLTEQLGMNVEVVDIDEYTQWVPISDGSVDACLEVWPSGHSGDIQTYVRTGRVEDLGRLGPIGKIGWYVPTYLLQKHPELATWDGFKAPANIGLFSTSGTAPSGRFLGGDPSWTQYDGDIIRNLGLSLKVVMSGSEAETLSELDAAYARQDPLLFYFWLPHWAHVKYDLTNVALPPYSDACWAEAASGGIDCDYPTDFLFKIAWPGLKSANGAAYRLLQRLTFTTKDQLDMLGAVGIDGKTVDQAARDWVDANTSVWRAWVSP